jgi:hypothetical protein
MSQLYVKNRPPPVPQSEYEARRKKRDMEDILTVSGAGVLLGLVQYGGMGEI